MDFFSANPLLVRQPKRFLVDESEYHCFDGHGRRLAHVREEGLDTGRRIARHLAASYGVSSNRRVVVHDGRGPRLVIEKQWSWMTATTTVQWPDGRPVGSIEQDVAFFKAKFGLLDPWKRPLGSIEGDFLARDFRINDTGGHEVARVDRRVPDLGELFTSADSYALHHRYPALPEPLRTMVVASGIAIDLVLLEGR
ncbi:phospholipid scramblase-related protein [Nocardiopsis changdeensis]|uniref:Scramblase n=1 Tax=Nocardiopsis changdeensis TaxID=2831969 RepID=A0ABX8BMK1_9ACTN|nr:MULTISPECIES: phospholipid scramblase-related protein [Nocardiopsis]QUX23475.1 scramblase [Nocardiopsis changdeensis]QYX39419.1 scramblase [Nocardiopsis sp. MT53]